jgi:membrane-bound lytic murein transglycosylase D
MNPTLLLVLRAGLLSLLTACSSPTHRESTVSSHVDWPVAETSQLAKPASYSGVFLKPASLEPAVDFWRKTYGRWSRAEVAFHDDRYLDVVYEVMVLPGVVGEGLTNDQKERVAMRKAFWKAQLAGLETKLRYGAALSEDDRQVLATLERNGKSTRVLEGASERLRSQRGTRERFKRGLEVSGRYDLQFRKIFREAGLPEELAYLPHVESSFQLTAKSSAGAVGLWQFTKAAAKTFMPGSDQVDQRLDPIASAYGAARYLRYAYGKLGDWPAAVTSYNHGIGGMKRAQNQTGSDFARIVEHYDGPAFGFASRNYYAQFLAAREIASQPEQYFKEGIHYEMPQGPVQYLAAE